MNRTPISLQLYSLRDDTKADFPRTLREVAKIGYAGVELAGYGTLDAKQLKAVIDDTGLKVSGVHSSYQVLKAELNTVIQDTLNFGSKHVVCSWWPATHFVSAAACQKVGEQLAEIGRVLNSVGLQLSFHNHAGEMKLIDGRTAYEWILSAAAPRDLAAEPDVYWVQFGGRSPAQLLRTLGARCPLIHLKDEKELGLGPVSFPEIFAAAEEIGAVEWYVVEQEKYNHAPLQSVRLCFEQLQRWGKA